MDPDYLTTAQAAAILGLNSSSVCRLIRHKILPAFSPNKKLHLIRREDLAKAANRPRVGNPHKPKA